MKHILEYVNRDQAGSLLWFKKLATIFDAIDHGYERAAAHYGFACRGCEDSCCLTRFYHHTLLEYVYVYEGYARLDPNEKQTAKSRAAEYCREHGMADATGEKIRVMCPLNVDGMCAVYKFRPLICRLHGIPHELHRPGRDTLYGPGCDCFDVQNDGKNYHPFDRTPFYKAMAGLEKEFRQKLGVHDKFRQTIAEMILAF